MKNGYKLRRKQKEFSPDVYNLVWTKHAKERAEERFSITEFPDTIDLTSPYIRFNNYREKDNSYVYKVMDSNVVYYLALKIDSRNTLAVVTVKEDACRQLGEIKDLF